jgi:hypothetical protein
VDRVDKEKLEGYEKIEDLQAKEGTPAAVYAGVMAAQGWKPGRMVTAEEYEAAVEAFAKAPMDGRNREEEKNVQ